MNTFVDWILSRV